MRARNWVDMQTRAIKKAAVLAPMATITPVLMQWTFDPNSGRNPADWQVSSAKVFSPSAVCRVMPWTIRRLSRGRRSLAASATGGSGGFVDSAIGRPSMKGISYKPDLRRLCS